MNAFQPNGALVPLTGDRRSQPRRTVKGKLWWKREGDDALHEARLIDESANSRAFVTAYEQRPDRTDLVQLVMGDPKLGEQASRKALVRRVDSYEEDSCLVVCTDVEWASAVPPS